MGRIGGEAMSRERAKMCGSARSGSMMMDGAVEDCSLLLPLTCPRAERRGVWDRDVDMERRDGTVEADVGRLRWYSCGDVGLWKETLLALLELQSSRWRFSTKTSLNTTHRSSIAAISNYC
ncbi:hypothetical protein GALMADRAFT_1140382 [Galerina marginata CBS 339.88]|uniref:Uncharacterized protein n=1 Tax=Galerina marginata (strain CBS 339.88) TaxID=685588 RepID=A0A067SJ11_GALM3|nr:hypothetical protein GALMADRAFT_1140382 [Galerina marginata CBS 339.88]